MTSPQIPLQLSPRRGHRLEDFVAGHNEPAVAALVGSLDEPGALVYVQGSEGTGKTHLLGGLCLEARERGLTASYLGLKRLPLDAVQSLEGLEHWDLACVDDLQVVAGKRPWEEALFHCFNRIRDAGGRLVLSATHSVGRLELSLPDLASRLGWGVQLQLVTLEEEQKLQVLTNRAGALGIELPEDVQQYLIRRSRRSMGELVDALERTQEEAFRLKRRITVKLVREVLSVSP